MKSRLAKLFLMFIAALYPFFVLATSVCECGTRLVVPLEVCSETELTFVAKLARRLMLGQTTLEAEFPGYRYGQVDWLREQNLR